MGHLEGCRIGSESTECVPQPLIAAEAGSGWILASFDGDSLLVRRGFSELARCRLGSRTSLCHPEPILFPEDSPQPVELVHSGNLIAFKATGLENRLPPGCDRADASIGCNPQLTPIVRLHACWLDRETSLCDPIPLTSTVPFESVSGLDVSRRRVVWAVAGDDENMAVHFCEFIQETRECVDQRLGGAAATQKHPSIDSNRVVWEDARLGKSGIFGFELPRLRAPRRLRSRPGQPFWIPLWGTSGSSDSIRYEVHAFDGIGPESAHARVVVLRPNSNHAILFGRIPESASGDILWRLRAIGDEGVYTDQILKISVEGQRRRHRARPARVHDRNEKDSSSRISFRHRTWPRAIRKD